MTCNASGTVALGLVVIGIRDILSRTSIEPSYQRLSTRFLVYCNHRGALDGARISRAR